MAGRSKQAVHQLADSRVQLKQDIRIALNDVRIVLQCNPMPHVFIERRDDGKYTVTQDGAKRASVATDTQKEAIQESHRMFPGVRPDVERQRETDRGGRDKWRKG